MSVTMFNPMVSGLIQLGSAYEWVVTKNVGRALETDLMDIAEEAEHHQCVSVADIDAKKSEQNNGSVHARKRKMNRIYSKQLAIAYVLLITRRQELLVTQQ